MSIEASLLILNPALGERNKPVLAQLRSRGVALMEVYPESESAIGQSIREYADKVARVIIAGGDGTLRCAADALKTTGLPLGIVPMGTANDLAHSLAIPLATRRAIDVILQGRVLAVDLGQVNDASFFNAAQIGLGASVKRRLSSQFKKVWGPLSYAIGAWDAVRHAHSFQAEVDVDGVHSSFKTVHVTVGNGVRYGGGTLVAPNASITDARLDLFSIGALPLWRMALLAAAIRRGKHDWTPHIHVHHGRRIRVVTEPPLQVTADGEDVTKTPADFSVLPGAVRIFVP